MPSPQEMSILVLLLLLGVASPKHISYYDNGNLEHPIITRSQERRICAELCMAGLGGEPCGVDCGDIIPQGLPRKSQSESAGKTDNNTRKDACPVLCANRLGYPLCSCNNTQNYNPFFKVKFVEICSLFCVNYDYQIFGCPKCWKLPHENDDSNNDDNHHHNYFAAVQGKEMQEEDSIDWNAWCIEMCEEGEGGAACYCDLLPMMSH